MTDDRVFTKCAWRLIPFMMLLYLVNYFDRVNVGFAALTMNKDLGFTPEIYGFGAGIFFFSYALSQIPASVIIERIGPRRGIMAILIAWGVLSAANAFVFSPITFYVLRFLLGIAEAGFYPGILVYMTLWFPKAFLARCIAFFQVSNPLAFVLGGPLSGFILGLDGVLSLHGWQWLFLLEGLPACLLALAVYRFIPAGPKQANWLDNDEKATIGARLGSEEATAHRAMGPALRDPLIYGLGLAAAGFNFSSFGVLLWLPQIVQAMGVPNGIVGLLLALPFVFAAVVMMFMGYSSDVRGERVWHIASAALVTAFGLFVASATGSNVMVFIGLTIAIIGQASLPVLTSALTLSFLRGPAAAGGFALFNMMAQLGAFLGPIAMGFLKQETGGYTAGLILLALATIASALTILALGRALGPRT